MKFLLQLMLLVAAFASSAPVFAGDVTLVSVNYSGIGYDTTIEVVPDGLPVNLSLAKGKGTFGNSDIAITAEFVPDDDPGGNCQEGDMSVAIVPDHLWAVTITASDNSQVYGMFNEGWMCLTSDMMFYVGEANGVFIGGTGRYEGATGEWVSTYQGMNLDPSIGFRSINGYFSGTLNKH